MAETARRAGARWLEACPVEPWDEPRSYRGAASTYRRLGFVEVLREPVGDGLEALLLELDLEPGRLGQPARS